MMISEFSPFDDELSDAQIDGVLALLGAAPRRVLDLGCGTGRLSLPLAAAGHAVVAIDRAMPALDGVRTSVPDADEARLDIIEGDFLEAPLPPGPFDMVLCVGNTFMLVPEITRAIGLTRRIVEVLRPDGSFVIDDLPGLWWPELTAGNWQEGIAEDDGGQQLVWDDRDAVFALRRGHAVDEERWTFGDDDRRLRLWTDGDLTLLARCCGLSDPVPMADCGILAFRVAAPGE